MKDKLYKHVETGMLYRLLGVANKGCTKKGWVEEAVYIDMKDRLWARPLVDFNLRFEELD